MDRDPYRYFRIEARELVDQLGECALELDEQAATADLVARMLRSAHTLKGAARVVRLPDIADRTHALEEELHAHRGGTGPLPPGRAAYLLGMVDELSAAVSAIPPPGAPATAPPPAAGPAPRSDPAPAPGAPADAPGTPGAVRPIAAPEPLLVGRTDADEVNALLDAIAETQAGVAPLRDGAEQVARVRRGMRLLLAQVDSPGAGAGGAADRIRSIVSGLDTELAALGRSLSTTVERTDRDLRQVRAGAERLRLVPAGTVFPALARAVRDAAAVQGRRAVFTGAGGTIRIDPQVLSAVYGALLHVVRNAVAHGIEPATDRTAAGKPPDGAVRVEVTRRGDRIRFACRDDGAGYDLAAVRASAARAGVPDTGALTARQLVDLTLRGGVSTAAGVTSAAGRAVGLDAVREVAQRLGGQVIVDTAPGRGTTVELLVPLSLLALDAMTVEAGGVLASIPLDAVARTARIPQAEVAWTGAGATVRQDGAAVPLLPLARVLARTAQAPADRPGPVLTVLIRAGTGTAAVGVDRILGTQPVVVRGLPALARTGALVSGVSLDGSGNPQLVLDPDGLVAAARGTPAGERPAAARATDDGPVLVIDDSVTTRMLERSILESAGYRVDVAACAEEGLEMAREKRYALILVDIEMPGMDGFTFVETIRADPELRDIPAVLVSSLASPEHRARGVAAGANLHVAKHEFNQNELIEQIRELVRR